MSPPSNSTSAKSRRRFPLFGKRADLYTVTGYEIGTIHTDQDIDVPQGTAVAGDIIGETIQISGQVFGNMIAREVSIAATGVVWGDIFARKINIEPGATTRGWINTVDEAALIEYLNNGHPLPQVESEPEMVPAELRRAVDQISAKLPPERATLIKNLTAELAAARLARFELEKSFENRLQTMSADRVAEAEGLREEVELLQRDRVVLQQKTGELTANTQQLQESLDKIAALLQEKEQDLQNQLAELNDLENRVEVGEKSRSQTHQENQKLKADLALRSREAEELADRINSLEAALKASNQRSAEQEQALIHWQELAEINEEAARDAKGALEDLEYVVKQNTLQLENLQQEKERLVQQLADDSTSPEVIVEPAGVEASTNTLQEQLEQLQAELTRKTKEVNLSKQALVESTAAYNQTAQQNAFLEEQLAAYQSMAEKREMWEQRIFDLDDQLELSELKLAKMENDLKAAEAALAEKDARLAALQDNVDRLPTANISQVDLDSSKKYKIEKEEAFLIDQIKKQHERDINYLNDQIALQGQTLAETRAALVEEQLKVQNLLSQIDHEKKEKSV